MSTCPFFNICGGCEFDFFSKDYFQKKESLLPKLDYTHDAIWGEKGQRRRAEFAFNESHFGFFKKHSKDIVDVVNCCNLLPEINEIVPKIAKLPWNGSGNVLITLCANGISVSVISILPVYSAQFKEAVKKLPANI
ncbi:MAG: hypothetical protein MJ156_00840, partial [Alphaproteobacteria bacterium]|nr:hypothetical protein [Alphaproteobacteria bacterium]